MRRMGIEALYRRPRTSKPEPGHKVYPYLLRDAGRPLNRVIFSILKSQRSPDRRLAAVVVTGKLSHRLTVGIPLGDLLPLASVKH